MGMRIAALHGQLFPCGLSDHPGWTPCDNSIGRHVFGANTAGANNGVFPHSNATQERHTRANRSAALHHRGFTHPIGLCLQLLICRGSAWEPVIDKRHIVTDKDIILDGHTLADKGMALDFAILTNLVPFWISTNVPICVLSPV